MSEIKIISRKDAKAAGLRFYFTGNPCKYGHVAERLAINGSCVVCQERLKVEYRVANREKACVRSAAWRASNPERAKEANAAYYAANSDKVKEQSRQWHRANPERSRANSAAYYSVNSERMRAKNTDWRKSNSDHVKAYESEYRKVNKEEIKARHSAWRSKNMERVRENGRAWTAANIEKERARKLAWRNANIEDARKRNSEWKKAHPDVVRVQNNMRRARICQAAGFHTAKEVADLMQKQKCKCANCKVSLKNGYHADHIFPLSKGGSNWIANVQLLCAGCNQRKHAKDPIRWAQENGRLL